MKKLLIYLALAFSPLVAMAAYNDVTPITGGRFDVGGIILDADGTSSVIESATVAATTLTVVLQENSLFSITSADRYTLSNDAAANNITANQCGDVSRLSLSATSSVTVIITPSTTVCSATTSTGTGGGGVVSSSSSSSSSSTSTATPTTTTTTTTTTVATPTPTPAPTTTATSDLEAKIAILKASISSLGGATTTNSSSSSSASNSTTFTKPASIGSRSSEVTSLQKVLNSDSDTMIASTGAGSPGNETDYFGPATKVAIQKFQVKYGIANPGDVGYGVFGPKTRAKMNEVANGTSLGGTTTTSSSSSSNASNSTTFTKPASIGSRSSEVTSLQKVLNSDSDTMIASTGAGSPGNETDYFGPATKVAIQKFQVKYGIANPGDVGYGVFGPKTRAKMNEVANGTL